MKRKGIVLLFLLPGILPLNSQKSDDLIKNISTRLLRNETTVSGVLSDTSFMCLHSTAEFREVIKQHAKDEKIKLNADSGPGTKITIKGLVTDRSANPRVNKLVYVYHTSSGGWYSATAAHILKNEGDRRHARL